MSVEDIFEQAAEDIFGDLGITALYTPSVGDPVECVINYIIQTNNEPAGFETQVWGSSKTIETILSVIGKEPDAEETFTITEGKYIDEVLTVQTVVENDGIFVKVTVK